MVGVCGWWDRFRTPPVETDGTARPTPPGQWRSHWITLIRALGFQVVQSGYPRAEHSTPLVAPISSPGASRGCDRGWSTPSDRRCPTNRGAGLYLRLLALPQCERPV